MAIAVGIALMVDLVIVTALLWPGLVPTHHRQTLRLMDVATTAVLALLVVMLLVDLTRAYHARREAYRRQQVVFDAMPNGIALWGADDRLEFFNADFVDLYAPIAEWVVPGVTFEQLLRRAVEKGLVPESSGREEEWIAARLARHRKPSGPMLRRLPGDQWRRIAEQRLDDGRILSHSIDVTELVAARADADLARRRLEDAIEALPAGFELYDADDRLIASNTLLKEMYPRVADLLGQPVTWEELVRENLRRGGLPELERDFEQWLPQRRAQRLAGGAPRVQALADDRWIRTYERKTREGGVVGVRIDVSEVMLQDRELRRLNLELDDANAELRRLAGTDPLTGIGNRRTFDKRLRQGWEAGDRLAILLLDVDYFKRYNDHHGHPAGDAVLRRIAGVLVAAVRSPSDLVARIGGEEFAVLMSPADGPAAVGVAERCLALLAEADIAHAASPIGPRVTASIGVTVRAALPEGATQEQFVQLADEALYAAKANGRSRTWLAGSAALPEPGVSVAENGGA